MPPIFDDCTAELSYADEEAARDLYWAVVQGASSLSDAAAVTMLDASIDKNRFVAEPSVLLAQYHFKAGRFAEARTAAGAALEKFYAFGGTWDKRLTCRGRADILDVRVAAAAPRPASAETWLLKHRYEAWLAFARMLVVRSTNALRAGGGAAAIKERGTMPRAAGDKYYNRDLGVYLHPIPKIIEAMP